MRKLILMILVCLFGNVVGAQDSVIKGSIFDKDDVLQSDLIISLYENVNGERIKIEETTNNPFEFFVDDETKAYEIGAESTLPNDGQSVLDVVELKNYILTKYDRLNKVQLALSDFNGSQYVSTIDMIYLTFGIVGDDSGPLKAYRLLNEAGENGSLIDNCNYRSDTSFTCINKFDNGVSNSKLHGGYVGDPMFGSESYISKLKNESVNILSFENKNLVRGMRTSTKIRIYINKFLEAAQFGFQFNGLKDIEINNFGNTAINYSLSENNMFFTFIRYTSNLDKEEYIDFEVAFTPEEDGHISSFFELAASEIFKTEYVYEHGDSLQIGNQVAINFDLLANEFDQCETYWPKNLVLTSCQDLDVLHNPFDHPCMTLHPYSYQDEYFYENDECIKVVRTWIRFYEDGSFDTHVQTISFSASAGDFCLETKQVILNDNYALLEVDDLISTGNIDHDYSFDFFNILDNTFSISSTVNKQIEVRTYDLSDSVSCYTTLDIVACSEGSQIIYEEFPLFTMDENNEFTLTADKLDKGSFNHCDEIVKIEISKSKDGPYLDEISFNRQNRNASILIYLKYTYMSGETALRVSNVRLISSATRKATFRLYDDYLEKGKMYEIDFRASDIEAEILGFQTELKIKDASFENIGFGKYTSDKLGHNFFKDENILRLVWYSADGVTIGNEAEKLFSVFIIPNRDIAVSEIFSIEYNHNFATEIVNSDLEILGLELSFIYETRSLTGVQNEIENKELMIYPNLLTGNEIRVVNGSTKDIEGDVNIFNNQGQKVSTYRNFRLAAGKTTKMDLEASCLSDGLYYFNINGPKNNLTKRLVKMK